MPIKSKSLAFRIVLVIAWLLVALSSHEAAAQDAAPRDAYGRPLADQLGPIRYRHDGVEWIAIHADGSQEPAPAIVSESPLAPTAGSLESGYRLDPYSAVQVGSYPYAVAIGDVTGDGHADVLMTTTSYFDPVNDYSLFLFPQQASGTFGVPLRFPYLVQSYFAALVLADLDENGILDVVVGHNAGITVFLADGNGSLAPGVVTYDADATILSATDVDRDGHIDIVSLGASRGATIFFGDGCGGFSRTLPLPTHAHGSNDLETDDLNDDGIADLAVLDGIGSPSVNLSIHRHDGVDAFLTPPDAYLIDPSLSRGGIGVGDVTGDGLNDAVVSRPRNRPTWLWVMSQDGSGRLTGPTSFPSYDIPEPVEVTDLDRDGREDVAVLHGGWTRVGVYLQEPDGRLGAEALYTIPYASHYQPQGLAVGDFTSDGCPDVAIADYNSGLVILHGRGCVPHCETELCDDLNPCTDDSCDPAIGCVHANNMIPCDDENPCTTDDTCGDGQCHGGGSNRCAGTIGMFTRTTGLTVFNADTDSIIGTLPIGSPTDCSINADQLLGFVADLQRNVWVIDLTRSPPTLASGVNPIRISNSGVDTTISPDQRYVVVCGGGSSQSLSVVDIALRREIATMSVAGGCSSIEACPDGSVLATSFNSRKIHRFRIDPSGHLSDTGELLGTSDFPVNSVCAPHAETGLVLARSTFASFGIPGLVQVDQREPGGYVFSGAINRAGDRLFLRSVDRVLAYGYDESTGSIGTSPIFAFYPNVNADASSGVDEIAVHPEGTKFYTLGDAPTIKMNVYSTETGQKLGSIPAERDYPKAVCFPSMECVSGAALQCFDGDACTVDACDALGRCTHVPTVCDDDNVCTADTCDPTTGCVFAPTVDCDDGNLCTIDNCDPATGCVHVDNTSPCEDGDACTSGDTCGSGHCRPGGATNCDDANCCTIDSCDPATGCIHSANTTAPVFAVQPSLGDCPTLWPPNHMYADFTVPQTGAVASSACGIASIQFASCFSSQPENGAGTADGNTIRDCVFEPYALHLRAERDGTCSPIGRVYETSLVAVDVCGNTTASNPLDVGVYHDRGHSPTGGTVYSGSNNGGVSGTNGTYDAGCGGGSMCTNGSSRDNSDADPEMEISQGAAISVNDLRLGKSGTGIQLTWSAPVQQGITRYHVWVVDPMAMDWTQIGGDLDKHVTSYLDPCDGFTRYYKVTAVIK